MWSDEPLGTLHKVWVVVDANISREKWFTDQRCVPTSRVKPGRVMVARNGNTIAHRRDVNGVDE